MGLEVAIDARGVRGLKRDRAGPTQLGRALAVDGALAFVAAHGAGGALRVACTALGQGGETAAEDGAPADEAPPLLTAQAAARDAPALAMPFDTCSLDEFPALG